MINSANFLEKIVQIVYNDDGKSFEDLLSEGIQQVNLQNIQKQIAIDATLEKRSDCE